MKVIINETGDVSLSVTPGTHLLVIKEVHIMLSEIWNIQFTFVFSITFSVIIVGHYVLYTCGIKKYVPIHTYPNTKFLPIWFSLMTCRHAYGWTTADLTLNNNQSIYMMPMEFFFPSNWKITLQIILLISDCIFLDQDQVRFEAVKFDPLSHKYTFV